MNKLVAGIDEVGRGALAGPLLVGAVADRGLEKLVPELLAVMGIAAMRDSKKLTLNQRERAFAFLERKIDWSLGEVSAGEIDELGLGSAIRIAAGRALDGLKARPFLTSVLADASLFHSYEAELATKRFVKGDESILPISLASVMAKVVRDRRMKELAIAFPHYGWTSNVGYGTKAHFEGLRQAGETPEHRRLFLRRFSLDSGDKA